MHSLPVARTPSLNLRYRKTTLYWVALSLFVVIFFGTTKSNALVGNVLSKAFSVPCLVACGGNRGVVNTKFLGDVLTRYVTGPTIEEFERASNRSIDRGIGLLTDAIETQRDKLEQFVSAQVDDIDSRLTSQREALVTDLDEMAAALFRDIMSELDSRINDLRIIAERGIGDLDMVGRTNALRLAFYLSLALLIGVFVFFAKAFAFFVLARQQPSSEVKTLKLGSVLLSIFLVAVVVIFLTYSHSLKRLEKDLLAEYRASMKGYDFARAAVYASMLNTLDTVRPNPLHALRLGRAEILRDVLLQPERYATEAGIAVLHSRIEDIENKLIAYDLGRDPDLTILAGLVSWQAGPDRYSEYAVAMWMADVISGKVKAGFRHHDGADPVVLKPLAYHYLNMYLADPVPDWYWEAAIGDLTPEESRKVPHLLPYTIAELKALARSNSDLGEVYVHRNVAAQIDFGRETTLIVRTLHSSLSQALLILTDTNNRRGHFEVGIELSTFPPLGPDQRQDLKRIIGDAEESWLAYTNYLRGIDRGTVRFVLAATSVPHHFLTYLRVLVPLTEGEPLTHPLGDPVALNKCGGSPLAVPAHNNSCLHAAIRGLATGREESRAYDELLRIVEGSLSRERIARLRSVLEMDWQEQYLIISVLDGLLYHLWYVVEAYSDPEMNVSPLRFDPIDRSIALAASIGLFGCSGSEKMAACESPTQETAPLLELMLNRAPADTRRMGLSQHDLRLILARRNLIAVM